MIVSKTDLGMKMRYRKKTNRKHIRIGKRDRRGGGGVLVASVARRRHVL